MAEVQQRGANQAQCWQCGAVVYKGTKNCPKCNAPSPSVSMATQRKVSLILLRVGLPIGIVSLIVGFILLVKGISIFGLMNYATFGVEIACLLIVIGISGLVAGPFMHFSVKKREQQLKATREGQ